MGMVAANSLWIVGTGVNIHFWSDNWLGEPLLDLLQVAPHFHDNFDGTVANVILNGRWNIPQELLDVPQVVAHIGTVVLPTSNLSNLLVWLHSSDGKLSAKHALSVLRPVATSLPWADIIWTSCIPLSH